jgi:LuxR family maltose regulon positive regulatory protein
MEASSQLHSLPQQLVQTKLYVPPVRASLVARPRLVERLVAGLRSGRRLTLLSAPAGSGKTTLASTWLSRCGCPAAWLSLDAADNDPTRFLHYLIAALQDVAPGVGETARLLLQSPQPPAQEPVLALLVNQLCTLPNPAILVLDDYHLISAAVIHQAVAYLLDHLPAQVHLAILTRTDPPLPLSRLRARGQLTEIRAADLCFTDDEASAFLNDLMALGLSGDDVAKLVARTEGWIAGLQLAALSMEGRDDVQSFISAFSGSHRYIVDYLVDEVLDRQPDAEREFLLCTSILERMNGPLCNAVLGRTDGQATLVALEQANLFLVPLDDDRRWYRYHHLFAQVLRSCLQEMHPDRLPELHHRAAEWYEENGAIGEAFYHALAAGDRERAARVIERDGRPMIMRGEMTTVRNWFEVLGEETHGSPWLDITRAWLLVMTADTEGVDLLLQDVEARIAGDPPADPAERQDMLGETATLRGLIAYFRGDVPLAIQLSQQALENLPERNQVVRGIAAHALGEAYHHNADLAQTSQANAEAARLAKASGSVLVAVSATSALADVQIEQGRLRQGFGIYQEAMQLAVLPDGTPLPAASRVYSGLARLFYEWNDLVAAARAVDHSIGLARRGGMIERLASDQIVLVRISQAQGDLEGAWEAMREAEQLAREHSLPAAAASLTRAFPARLWLAEGESATAFQWAEESGLSIDDPVPFAREPEYLTLLRVLVAQGEYDAALTFVGRMLPIVEAAGRVGRAIELLTYQARAYHGEEALPQALESLERALSLGQPEGYVRVFLDHGPPMAELLRYAGSQGMMPGYVTKLLSEFGTQAGEALAREQPLIEPLSARELEVLRQLATGKSNDEIASALVIATGTVKRHLNNIFGKLNVQNRTQCVARARELRLI